MANSNLNAAWSKKTLETLAPGTLKEIVATKKLLILLSPIWFTLL